MPEQKQKINPELKEIILQRVLSSKLPENIKLSIGNLSKEPIGISEMARHIREEDEIGEKIIEMEIAYLKALKEGIIQGIQNTENSEFSVS